MATETVRNTIKASLRLLGVLGTGEAASSDMETDAIQSLNFMIDQWINKRLLGYQKLNETFSAVASTASYSIGSGATWDTTRPLRIESAFYRSSDIDYDIDIINNKQYQEISQKTTEGPPTHLFYHPTMSNGTVYLWPVPDDAYTIGLSQIKQLGNYTAGTDTITLPPGYLNAIKYNLAIEIAAEYPEFAPSQLVYTKAQETIEDLKRTNLEPAELVRYEFDPGDKDYGYDILSDTVRL